jgi:hypothetical protein
MNNIPENGKLGHLSNIEKGTNCPSPPPPPKKKKKQ